MKTEKLTNNIDINFISESGLETILVFVPSEGPNELGSLSSHFVQLKLRISHNVLISFVL